MSLEPPLLPKVASLSEAASIASDFESVISLAGSVKGREALKNHSRRLYCRFDDVLDDAEGVPADAEHILEIIEFSADAKTLLVHCEYGQSRSTAVALGVAVALGTRIEDAARELLQAHPAGRPFVPNERILGLFDHHLGCNGRLVGVGLEYIRI